MQNFCISCQNGIIYAGSWGYMVVMFHPIRPTVLKLNSQKNEQK